MALFTKMAGADLAVLMYADFEQKFPMSQKMSEPVTEEYYRQALEAIEKEGPAFFHHMMTGKFGPLPPDFGTKN